MRANTTAEAGLAEIRLAEEIANQKKQYRESEDPELNYMVHFSNGLNTHYEA